MRPFRDIDLRESLENIKMKMMAKIDLFSNEEIMANDLELLADNIYEEFYIQPVLIDDEEFSKRSIVQEKIHKRIEPFLRDIYNKEYVDVDGVMMTCYYPYVGETDLFKCRASTFSCSGYPEISISQDYISLQYAHSLQDAGKLGVKEETIKTLEQNIERIRIGIGYVNSDVSAFNKDLRATALKYLIEKRKKVEAFFSVAAMFEVPVKRNEYSEKHIPLKRNITPITHTYDRQESYCITDSDYRDVLDAIKHTGSTYERTPSSYKAMQEEDLRNTLLATLNATYKGYAAGEAFRNHGKTDICIELENRAAFVAECKMWNGQNEVEAALQQLDSYLTWRDCKTALIYFVRRKDFLKTLTNAEAALKKLSIMRQVQVVDKNEFTCCMVSKSNLGQIVQVRVMLFNMNC